MIKGCDMNIKKRFIIYFVLIFGVVCAMGSFSVWSNLVIGRYLDNDFPAAIESINKAAYLNVIAQLIRYDDEVLTQAARNYAFTGEKKWRDRYFEFVPKLDLRINQALEQTNNVDAAISESINSSFVTCRFRNAGN